MSTTKLILSNPFDVFVGKLFNTERRARSTEPNSRSLEPCQKFEEILGPAVQSHAVMTQRQLRRTHALVAVKDASKWQVHPGFAGLRSSSSGLHFPILPCA